MGISGVRGGGGIPSEPSPSVASQFSQFKQDLNAYIQDPTPQGYAIVKEDIQQLLNNPNLTKNQQADLYSLQTSLIDFNQNQTTITGLEDSLNQSGLSNSQKQEIQNAINQLKSTNHGIGKVIFAVESLLPG